MSDRPRVGGLDPRFAPDRPGRVRLGIVLVAVAIGAAAGVLFAASSVPAPNCAVEDGMCKLQRIYLAQGVKVIFSMLVAYLLAESLVIRLPDRMAANRRRRAHALERSLRPPPEPPRPFDASLARAALDRVGQTASLPPAALRALGEGTGAPPGAAPGASADPARPDRPPETEAGAAARAALEALSAAPRLPPAALEALLRQGPALGGGRRRAPDPPPE